ncbi:Endo-1,4-beta-xylanase A [bioreactor metagenome]|uniref:Endo-1,4-beta-xylanase A n=1 Tax=bioreactor metagenome TaxID=1076179 RepID=A0A645FP93_9ZZZZ
MIAIPDGVDPSKITTGVVVDPDGTVHHVPTKITVIDGKYYAVINSLTNSAYSVIWNPVEFTDVENHWAKSSVNNMGSRIVVSGVGSNNYEPDRDITRAEFAAIMVRALGLEPGKGASGFDDVSVSDWFSGYIKTASEFGLINGYGTGMFGPNNKITREQAMTIIARAMKITGLETSMTAENVKSLLSEFTDGTSISAYAKDGIAACISAGIVKGKSVNTIAPTDNITRAEVAVIVERLLQKSDLI